MGIKHIRYNIELIIHRSGGLIEDCGVSIAQTLGIPQSCAEPLIL